MTRICAKRSAGRDFVAHQFAKAHSRVTLPGRTNTRSLVNVEILAIKRHRHRVRLRKVAIHPYSVRLGAKSQKPMQVAVSLTPYPQACSDGAQRPLTMMEEAQPVYFACVRTIAYKYNCYFSPLIPTPILSKSAQASIVSNKRHLPITTAMKFTITTFLALVASAIALPTAQSSLPMINSMCMACQSSCRSITKSDPVPGAYRTCMINACAGRVRDLAMMIAHWNTELIFILVRYTLVDHTLRSGEETLTAPARM